jgi:hypothetical protein
MVGVGVIVGVGVGVGTATPDISIKLLSLNWTSISSNLPYPDTTTNPVGESKYPLPGLVTMIAGSEKLEGIKEADIPVPLPFIETKLVGEDTNPEPESIITKDLSVRESALKVVENAEPLPEVVILLLGLDTKPEPASITINDPLVNSCESDTMVIPEPLLSTGVARVGDDVNPEPELIMITEDFVNSRVSNTGCVAIGEPLTPPNRTTGVESKPEPESNITKLVIFPLASTPVIFMIAGEELPPPVTNNSCPRVNPEPLFINPVIEAEVIPPADVRVKLLLLPAKVTPAALPAPVSTVIPVGDPVNP